MTPLVADSINEIQVALCNEVLTSGEDVEPRGMRTREILGCSFVLERPRNRLTTIPARNWSAALAVAELAWHLRADDDVSALEFYTPRWRDFANEKGVVQGSCYGARIFKARAGNLSQWESVKRLLKKDRSSRRAVLNFRPEEDVSIESKDISCTNTLQFILRDGQLHAFVSMRSNDAIWGVPYDVFLFTALQELMALELGVSLGKYYHTVSSMHIYERHFSMAEEIARSATDDVGGMPEMASVDMVMNMALAESHLRLNGRRSGALLDEFGKHCLRLLSRHRAISKAA